MLTPVIPAGVIGEAGGDTGGCWVLWLSSRGGLVTARAPSELLFTGGPGPSPDPASICSYKNTTIQYIFKILRIVLIMH